jgi:hypothetical protein
VNGRTHRFMNNDKAFKNLGIGSSVKLDHLWIYIDRAREDSTKSGPVTMPIFLLVGRRLRPACESSDRGGQAMSFDVFVLWNEVVAEHQD